MAKVLENLEKYLLYLILFFVPTVVIGIFANPFEVPKVAIIILGTLILLLLFSIRLITKRGTSFSVSAFDLPVLLLAFVYLAGSLIQTPNKMEAFLVPGFASVVIMGSVFYFFLNYTDSKKIIAPILTAAGSLISIVTLLAYAGVLAKISFLPNYAQSVYFNLSGGYLPQLITLGIILPLSVGLFLGERETAKKAFYAVCTLVIIAGAVLSAYNVMPNQPGKPTLPSHQVSWSIAVDTLKSSPLLGVGPGNYLTAFNRLRPISYNQTDLWSIRFSTASSFFLTHLTEVGLLGLGVFILLVWKVIKSAKNKENVFGVVSLGISLLGLFILPSTTVLLFLLFVLLALNSREGEKKVGLSLAALPLLLLALVGIYFAIRGLSAEYTYKKSLDALVANDGRTTYDTLRATINTNPYVDRYHASYAQVTIALARGLAQKAELTDQDKNTIAQLIQQAIRDAKATVALNQGRSANWEILARTYQAIMPFAQGADQFAIQTFTQAVALDPFNPNLRIALGGVYYALGNYDEAIRVFSSAVAVKSDLANAHYNLSAAYREKGDIQKAIDEMNIVLGIVAADSPDHELASTELEALQKRLPSEESLGTGNLIPPLPAEDPVITPPLELPEEANPPASAE